MAPSVNPERQKKYRDRLKALNLEKYKTAKKKNAERMKRKRKKISDCNDEEKESLRQSWRDKKKKKPMKEKKEKELSSTIKDYRTEGNTSIEKTSEEKEIRATIKKYKKEETGTNISDDAETIAEIKEEPESPQEISYDENTLSAFSGSIEQTPVETRASINEPAIKLAPFNMSDIKIEVNSYVDENLEEVLQLQTSDSIVDNITDNDAETIPEIKKEPKSPHEISYHEDEDTLSAFSDSIEQELADIRASACKPEINLPLFHMSDMKIEDNSSVDENLEGALHNPEGLDTSSWPSDASTLIKSLRKKIHNLTCTHKHFINEHMKLREFLIIKNGQYELKSTAKIFNQMLFRSPYSSFTVTERLLSLCLYKTNRVSYYLMCEFFNMPSTHSLNALDILINEVERCKNLAKKLIRCSIKEARTHEIISEILFKKILSPPDHAMQAPSSPQKRNSVPQDPTNNMAFSKSKGKTKRWKPSTIAKVSSENPESTQESLRKPNEDTLIRPYHVRQASNAITKQDTNSHLPELPKMITKLKPKIKAIIKVSSEKPKEIQVPLEKPKDFLQLPNQVMRAPNNTIKIKTDDSARDKPDNLSSEVAKRNSKQKVSSGRQKNTLVAMEKPYDVAIQPSDHVRQQPDNFMKAPKVIQTQYHAMPPPDHLVQAPKNNILQKQDVPQDPTYNLAFSKRKLPNHVREAPNAIKQDTSSYSPEFPKLITKLKPDPKSIFKVSSEEPKVVQVSLAKPNDFKQLPDHVMQAPNDVIQTQDVLQDPTYNLTFSKWKWKPSTKTIVTWKKPNNFTQLPDHIRQAPNAIKQDTNCHSPELPKLKLSPEEPKLVKVSLEKPNDFLQLPNKVMPAPNDVIKIKTEDSAAQEPDYRSLAVPKRNSKPITITKVSSGKVKITLVSLQRPNGVVMQPSDHVMQAPNCHSLVFPTRTSQTKSMAVLNISSKKVKFINAICKK